MRTRLYWLAAALAASVWTNIAAAQKRGVDQKASESEGPMVSPAAEIPQEPPRRFDSSSLTNSQRNSASELSERSNIRPSVEIVQKMPESIRFDSPVPIEITITNTGPVAVDEVVVTNLLSSDTEFLQGIPEPQVKGRTLIWSLGRLDTKEKRNLKFSVGVKPGIVVPNVLSSANVRFLANVTNATKLRRPKLKLSVIGPSSAPIGEPVEYAITITNKGDARATGVLLRNTLPQELTHPFGSDLENLVGDLAPGQTRSIKLSVTPIATGKLVSRMLISADGQSMVQQDVILQATQIILELTGKSPKRRYLKRPCKFEFMMTNSGTTEAKEVRLVANCPTGVTFVSASDNGKYVSAMNSVTWNLGVLEPGRSQTVHLSGIASKIGVQSCSGTLTSGDKIRERAECTTLVEGIAALQLEVLDLQDPIEIGSETIYEIRVLNQGSIPVTNLVVDTKIPPEFEVVATDTPTGHHLEGDILSFDPVPKLAPLADVIYRIRVKSKFPGDVRFRVTITSDQLSKPVIEEESTTIFADD